MTRKETVYEFLRKMKNQAGLDAIYTTEEIANAVGASRANVSSDLNRLFEEQRVEKLPGWPVRYRASSALLTPLPNIEKSGDSLAEANKVFAGYVGYNGSMSMAIEKAKAAVLYPLNGLPLLIGGKTGVGKTTFARLLYEYARRAGRIEKDAKFISFNCADYSNNPQLITAQLFGSVRGAYTGAEEDHPGLVDAADGGVLFLDEVHRLPATAQEMLFSLMDFSQYRRLGEVENTRTSHPIIIMATTENKDSALLATFNRRIPVSITLPSLAERSAVERLHLIRQLFIHEAAKLKLDLKVDTLTVKTLLAYECPGNVGQLENDIRVACAHAYVECLLGRESCLSVDITDMPLHVKEGLRQIQGIYSDINLIATDLEICTNDAKKEHKSIEPLMSGAKTDIYDILERQYKSYTENSQDKDYIELAMTLDIDNYIRNLMNRHDEAQTELIAPLSQQAIEVAQKADDIVKCELGISLDERYRMTVASHIDTAIARIELGKSFQVCPVLNRIQTEQPAIFDAAKQIVLYMRNDCGIDVPDDEIGFFANLLQQMINDCDTSRRSGLLVLSHALGSAGTMAHVANTILGKEFVQYLDLTDDLSAETTRRMVQAKLEEMSAFSSILALADSAALIQVCIDLQQESEKPLYVTDSMDTSRVIEAALLMDEKHIAAQQVYHHLQTIERNFNELRRQENAKLAGRPERKVIATACISGCGVATRLKKMIENNFEIPPEIELVTMDIPSVNALRDRVAALAAEADVICIVGMDVGLEVSFPFISVDEFVLGDGVQRLSNILSSYQIHHKVQSANAPTSPATNMACAFYNGKYLDNYLYYLSGDKLYPYLQQAVNEIEATRGEMRQAKRIMLTSHLASMVERLMFDATVMQPSQGTHPDLEKALEPVAAAYHIQIPDEEYEMLEQILSLVLNK